MTAPFGSARIEPGRGRRARQIDDDAIGTGQREHAMLDGAAQLEDDARAFGARPGADVLDGGGAARCCR